MCCGRSCPSCGNQTRPDYCPVCREQGRVLTFPRPIELASGGQADVTYCARCETVISQRSPARKLTNIDHAEIRCEALNLAMGPVWSNRR